MSDNYIKLNREQLKKLQGELLVLLLELDRICKKHNIKYFLSNGTLLGAIRHKGFIPWDDDVDVEMLRKDYDKFCAVCKEELKNSQFFLQTQETDEHYNWSYGKLRSKNTDHVRSGQEHLKQKTGIFIDIFPLDNTKNKKYIHNIIMYVCGICRMILWSNVGCKVSESKLERIKYKILSYIPRKLVIKIFNFLAKLYNDEETDYLGYYNLKVNDGAYHIEKKWYDGNCTAEFEGYEFPIPSGYDDILKIWYGDYMKIPDKENQEGHCHASYIRFSDGVELKV